MGFNRENFGSNSGAGLGVHIPGTAQKRPYSEVAAEEGHNEAREEEANLAWEQWKREHSSMSYGTTGTNTLVVRRRKGKWPKKSRLEKLAARLRYIRDATGDIGHLTLKVAGLAPIAAADGSKTAIVTLFNGTGGGMTNKGDLARIFPLALNYAAASSIATMRTINQALYLKSCHLHFDISMTANDGEVTMYECICLKDVGNGEIVMTSDDTFQDDWYGRMAAKTTNATGTTKGTKTDYQNSPYLWHEFGQYYKIIRSYQFIVQAGKSVKFDQHIKVNKILDPDRLSGNDHFRGLTRLFIFTVRGCGTGSATIPTCTAGVNIFGDYKFTTSNLFTPIITTNADIAT